MYELLVGHLPPFSGTCTTILTPIWGSARITSFGVRNRIDSMFDGLGICLWELIYFWMINRLVLAIFGCDCLCSLVCSHGLWAHASPLRASSNARWWVKSQEEDLWDPAAPSSSWVTFPPHSICVHLLFFNCTTRIVISTWQSYCDDHSDNACKFFHRSWHVAGTLLHRTRLCHSQHLSHSVMFLSSFIQAEGHMVPAQLYRGTPVI